MRDAECLGYGPQGELGSAVLEEVSGGGAITSIDEPISV